VNAQRARGDSEASSGLAAAQQPDDGPADIRDKFVVPHGLDNVSIRSELLAIAHVLARGGRAAFGDAAEHRDAASDGLNHGLDIAALFLREQRLVFAQRAEEDDAGDAGVNQRFGMAGRGFQVEGLILFELGGDGGDNARQEAVSLR
jgi:hypothetical protein